MIASQCLSDALLLPNRVMPPHSPDIGSPLRPLPDINDFIVNSAKSSAREQTKVVTLELTPVLPIKMPESPKFTLSPSHSEPPSPTANVVLQALSTGI